MKIKAIVLTVLQLLIITKYVHTQDGPRIYIVDYLTNQPIEFVQIYSLCQTNEVLFSDEKGMVIKSQKNSSCYKWELSHINYEVLQIYESDFYNNDTIRMTPIEFVIDEVNITSKKLDNQYLYDMVNALINKKRKNSFNSTNNYFFVLSSKTGNEVRENVYSNLKLDYNDINGFIRNDNSFVEGSFLFNKNAIFLNLETDKLILSFSPFSVLENEFSMPLNVKKISKKSHKIQRLICNTCNETEYLIQISSQNDSETAVLKFNYVTLSPIEYQIYAKRLSDMRLFRLNDDIASLEDFKIRYGFDDKDNFINLIEFEFNLKFDTLIKTRVSGIFNRAITRTTPFHIIKGKYSPDNLYEEISLSIPDSFNIKFKYNDNLTNVQDISEGDYSKLSSANSEILSLFLSLPKSKNKFLEHGKERINSSKYNIHLLEKEYWYYKYEKKIFNKSFLNFNWVMKIDTSDYIHWYIDTKPTLWNSNYSNIYSTYIDTVHFNFFSNLIFDWVETQRLKLFSRFDHDGLNHDIPKIVKEIDSTFNFVNDFAQSILFKFIDEKMAFEDVDKLNSEVKEVLGVDNLYLYFRTEIQKIIDDPKYESTIRRYIKCSYNNQLKDKTYAKYCLERSILLLDELIEFYENSSTKDLKILGSYYGLKAESHIMLGDIESACQCLNFYNKYWPGTIEYSPKKKQFYITHCQE